MKLLYKPSGIFRMKAQLSLLFFLIATGMAAAQPMRATQESKDPIVAAIIGEATNNSQLEQLAYELLDKNGPRLVGTPGMQNAHNWAVEKYKSWGIPAQNEKWGEWRGWERGVSHIDLISPRVKTLEGMQLAWSLPPRRKA